MAASSSVSPILQRPAMKRARTSDVPTRPGDLSDGDSHDLQQRLTLNDSLDYPRRRAVIACEICRSRKSRCDGGRPKCKLCTELDADCVYREPGIKLDAGDKLILKQLARLENLIQTRMAPSSALYSPSTSIAGSEECRMQASVNVPLIGLGTWNTNINAFPKAHTTPALHLLKWPVIKDLVFRPCDPRVLLELESSREPLFLDDSTHLDLGCIMPYVTAFFEQVNVWYAIVDPYTWHDYYRAAASANFGPCPETCAVLMVISLGQAAYSSQSVSDTLPCERPPGLDYFAAAWELLPTLLIRNDIITTQCHILAAAYLMYLVRPLEAWNMLYNASMKLQLLLSSSTSVPPRYKELSVRVYWNSLMIESDLLAELDLPQSGIVQYEDNIRLPRSFHHDTAPDITSPPPGDDSLWYFLAEIALRRLLNRVSHLIYTPDRSTPLTPTSLEPLVAELDYQLTQWYEGLPLPLKFPRDRYPTQDAVQTVLRLRYFACRTIIYRPYIQAVLADESAAQEPGVQDACRKCVDACRRQIEDVTVHRAGHLPYLWQGALSIFSQTLLLMAATLSPALAGSGMLPASLEMERIVFGVVQELERLATWAPSLRRCAEIMRESEDRWKTMRIL